MIVKVVGGRKEHPDWFRSSPSLLFDGDWGPLFLEIKRLERETGYSPPSSSEVKDE
jgi:hypothetical protein